ncbi:glycoside hydrolase family 38 C-terminal domain-containing protein, partial [Nonomuraea sp. NPDC004297]
AARARRADAAAPRPRDGGGHVLQDARLRVEIDARGLVVSARDLVTGREAVAPGRAANLLQLHPDFPNKWDAWDVDAFYRHTVTDLTEADDVRAAGGAVVVTRSFGGSRVTQRLTVTDGRLEIDTEVDWHETEKFLKLAFPLDVRADRYASESQFGHAFRPTHTNTSWEAAKFEACNHRFVHVEEPGWGVALVNDSTYGHDVTRDVDGHGTTTTLRASLLRAPRFPDPETDQGVHCFRHALVPGAAIGDAVREGYFVNLPERRVPGGEETVEPLVTVDDDAVVVTAVKLADDGSGDVIVRFHESRGGRARARLRAGFPVAEVVATDLLERPIGEPRRQGGEVAVELRSFELVTLRFKRA